MYENLLRPTLRPITLPTPPHSTGAGKSQGLSDSRDGETDSVYGWEEKQTQIIGRHRYIEEWRTEAILAISIPHWHIKVQ